MLVRLSLPLVFLAAGAGACGTGGQSALTTPLHPARFALGVNHSFSPITPGTSWIYQGEEDGELKREEVTALEMTRSIAGVECTGIQEHVFVADEMVERTTEWFAQDVQGNVWKFGEESFEPAGSEWLRTGDSWIAGEGDAYPWMTFPADPQVGDQMLGYRPGGQDELHVVSLSETAVVSAGVFSSCMKIVENPADPSDSDLILYAPGVGRIKESNAAGSVELVSFSPP